ncbi:MAG TPA: hypothetical protein VFF26_03535 [Gallionella sp.]|nr:hypothetical protein [Gallionella sp.]
MRNSVLLFVALATQASAEAVRCGTDDFGNTVCMDKEGVVISAPPDRRQVVSGVPSAGQASGNKQDDRRVRCGTDPFGNTVCR